MREQIDAAPAQMARHLTRWNVLMSAIFWIALSFAAWRYQSELAVAQAADSLLDVFGSLVLAWVVKVGGEPWDQGHPMGHSRAEPLGALLIAMLSAVLAIEVGTRAAESLLGAIVLQPSFTLLGLFIAKVLFKSIVFKLSYRRPSPVFRALAVDSRNDVLVGAVAVVGFVLARSGYPAFDAWLAIPIALWIGWSGIELARENIALLMGAAPPDKLQRELLEIAVSIPGIVDAHDLRAHYLGTILSLHVHVSVDENLSVRQGHDLGEAVRQALLDVDSVGKVDVHVDPYELA